MTGFITPLPANLRAEMARYLITRSVLAAEIGMNPTQLADYLYGRRELSKWAEHNITMGINRLVGSLIFGPVMPTNSYVEAPRGRPAKHPPLSVYPLLPMDDVLREGPVKRRKKKKRISKVY